MRAVVASISKFCEKRVCVYVSPTMWQMLLSGGVRRRQRGRGAKWFVSPPLAPHLPWMKAAAMPKLASMPALHAKLPPPRPLVWHRYIDNHWRPQQATKVRNALPRHRTNRISVCTSPRAEGPYVEHLVRSEVSAGAHRLSPADDREGEPGYPVPSRSHAEGATDYMRAPVGSQALLRIGSSATSRSSVELRRAE